MYRWIPVVSNERPLESGKGKRSLLAVGDFCPVKRGYDVPASPSSEPISWVGADLAELVAKSDLAMVNLEGPIAGAGAPISKAGSIQSIDPRRAAELVALGFDVTTLANNHIMDYGAKGLDHTLSWCASKGIQICGAGVNRESALQPAYFNVFSGVRIAVIAACEHEFGMAGQTTSGVAGLSDPDLEAMVATARQQADAVVVAAHGGCEEVPFPPERRRAQLRRLIDAGANLVVGHHAHVPQGWERWGRGLIFYSLGDFYFRWANGRYTPVRHWSIIIRAWFDVNNLLGVEVIPLETRPDGSVDLVQSGDVAERRLDYLEGLAEITAGKDLPAYWQATARRLWQEQYWPYLWQSMARPGTQRLQSLWKETLFRMGKRVADRVTGRGDQAQGFEPLSQSGQLLLLCLLRTESHRWAMETWLSAASGDTKNLVTPEVERMLDHYMELMRIL